MNRRLRPLIAWVVATLASILVALAGVSGVRSAIAAPETFRLPAADQALDLPGPIPETTSTTRPEGTQPTTTQPGAGVGSGSISAPSSTSATSTTAEEQHNTYQVEGGWVTIRTGDGSVNLESASPQSGWTVNVEKTGPEEVVVKFKGGEHETTFKADIDHGQVRISIDEDEDMGEEDD